MNEKRRMELIKELNKTPAKISKETFLDMLETLKKHIMLKEDELIYQYCFISYDDSKEEGVISVGNYHKDACKSKCSSNDNYVCTDIRGIKGCKSHTKFND